MNNGDVFVVGDGLVPDPTDYNVSATLGFVLPEPLQHLATYYDPWTDIINKLPQLISERHVRDEVNKLPLLDDDKLTTHRELRLAHLILSFIGGAYMWEKGEDEMPKVIPRALAVPWYNVSSRVGLPPIVNHASAALANYKLIDPSGPIDIDNLRLIHIQCGGYNYEWFFLIPLQIELVFARCILQPLLSCLRCVISCDNDTLSNSLDTITSALHDMKSVLSRIHESCDPVVFYNTMRPFLSGWHDVIYDGCHGNQPLTYSGGSAAQSSAVQCVDILLGIQHYNERGSFLIRMRDYMPKAHKAFLEALAQAPSLREYVKQFILVNGSTNNCSSSSLVTSYNRCVSALNQFRSYHIQMVARYVTIQANKAQSGQNKADGLANVGTGGTDLMPFLKAVRDDTVNSLMK